MKKIATIALLSLGFAHVASAMPCDTGWSCKSKSGKYEIELQRCRYKNSLNLETAKVDGKEIAEATLGAAYDSKSLGGKILAFEVGLPDPVNDVRTLAVEIVGQEGSITESVIESNPGSSKPVASEPITCEEVE